MIDGSVIRAHQHAAGARGGQASQALGRRRGGFSSKIHAKVDAFGMPLAFILTPGQEHEIKTAKALLGDEVSEYLLADKAYDCNHCRDELEKRGTEAVIPSKKNRCVLIEHDPHIYTPYHSKCEYPPAPSLRTFAARVVRQSSFLIILLTPGLPRPALRLGSQRRDGVDCRAYGLQRRHKKCSFIDDGYIKNEIMLSDFLTALKDSDELLHAMIKRL